jgi:hypothetical protein
MAKARTVNGFYVTRADQVRDIANRKKSEQAKLREAAEIGIIAERERILDLVESPALRDAICAVSVDDVLTLKERVR